MKIKDTTITVRDIQVYARHGVAEQERTVGNEFLVTVALRYDAGAAMQYDDVAQAVNYAEVIQIVRDVMLAPSLLIENVVLRLIDALSEAFPTVQGGTVSVTKVHPPISTPTGGATFEASFTR